MKVAVIGAGGVGTTLGAALMRGKGFEVKYGVRHPSDAKYDQLLRSQPGASVASVHDAVEWAEVAILATPGHIHDAGIQAVAASLGPEIKGKVLLDATNPLTAYPALELPWGKKLSAGEVLAAALPGTAVYKAFNTIGVEHMAVADGSKIGGQRLTMLVAGDEGAKHRRAAEAVVAGVGFLPAYVGPIRYARNLEAIAELWVHLSLPPAGTTKEDWGRNFHFQVVGKP